MRIRASALAAMLVVALTVLVLPASAQEQGHIRTDHVVESFDGTPIWTHLFLPAGASDENPVPLVLRTHGWGGTGETAIAGTLESLLDAGYAVVTWDQRGFGYSGGEVHIDKPDLEGRDASVLISWAVDNAPVAMEAPDDPIVGFTGGSYAGGIQMATAAFDPRVDALAPEITWTDLRYSLYDGGVINLGWGELLYAAGAATAQSQGLDPSNPAGPQSGGLAQEIHQALVEGTSTNAFSEDSLAFFADSSLAHYGQEHPVAIPTLVMNGSVDTLFDLTDGNGVFQHVKAQGAPAKFIAWCGGHVACPTSYEQADDRAHLNQAILTWFARYLKGEDVDTGAPFEYRTNEGVWRTASDFTPPDARFLTAAGEGSLISTPGPTSVDVAGLFDDLQGSGGLPILPITSAQPNHEGDPHAFSFEVAHAADGSLELVGIPRATLEVTGAGPAAHLFLKLIDREAGEVVNLQATPRRVTDLSGDAQVIELDLAGIAYTLPEGHHLDLQVSTTSAMHAIARTPAELQVSAEVSVPVRRQGNGGNAAPAGPDPGGQAPAVQPRGARAGLPATGGGAAGVPVLAMGFALLLGHRPRRR